VEEPSKDNKTIVEKFYDNLKNYKNKKPLEDLAVEGMTIKEFWEHGDKVIGNLSMKRHLF
jgi:hypothetical protein